MKHRFAMVAILVGVIAGSLGCSSGSLVVERPTSETVNRQVTVMWAKDVRRVARTGDWLLTRSYSVTGDVIVGATRGESVSHASIYDARTDTIVEAVRPEVREVPLEHLLDRNRLVIVVRPTGLSDAEREAAVDRARTRVGTEFDLRGLVGIDDPDKFYCSELVFWATRGEVERPFVITPARLMEYGEVVYYSGKRDKPETQEAARAQARLFAAR